MRTQHFNIFNTGTESFFTPGHAAGEHRPREAGCSGGHLRFPGKQGDGHDMAGAPRALEPHCMVSARSGHWPRKERARRAAEHSDAHRARIRHLEDRRVLCSGLEPRAAAQPHGDLHLRFPGARHHQPQKARWLSRPEHGRAQNAVRRIFRAAAARCAGHSQPCQLFRRHDGKDQGHRAGYAGRGERRGAADVVFRVRHAL